MMWTRLLEGIGLAQFLGASIWVWSFLVHLYQQHWPTQFELHYRHQFEQQYYCTQFATYVALGEHFQSLNRMLEHSFHSERIRYIHSIFGAPIKVHTIHGEFLARYQKNALIKIQGSLLTLNLEMIKQSKVNRFQSIQLENVHRILYACPSILWTIFKNKICITYDPH